MIHPGRYFAGIVAAGAGRGRRLPHRHARRERIEVDGAERVVHTPRGAIRAGAVLVATNGYTDGLCPGSASG